MNQKANTPSHLPLSVLMGLTSLLGLFLPLALVRVLGAGDVGQYKVFFLYSSTGPWLLLAAGLGNGLYFWAGRGDERQSAFSSTWALKLAWAGSVVVAGGLFLLLTGTDRIFGAASWLLVAAVAFTVPAAFYEEALIASGRLKNGAAFAAGFEFARVAAVLGSGLYWRTGEAVVAAHVGLLAVKLVVVALLASREGYRPTDMGKVREVLQYAWPVSVSASLMAVLNYVDQFVLGRSLSASEFAVYSLGCLSVPPLLVLEQSLNKVLIPRLGERLRRGDQDGAKSLHRWAVRELGLWLIPGAVGMFFFAEAIVRLLFTEKFLPAAHFLKLYSAYYLFFAFPFDAWARATGQTRWILRTIGGFAALAVVAVWPAARWFGAEGALLAFLVVQLLLRLHAIRSLAKNFGWRVREFFPAKDVVVILGASLLIGWLARLATSSLQSPLLILAAGIGSFGFLYLFTVFPWVQAQHRKGRSSRGVLHLTQYLHVGGLERMILNLGNELKSRGWESRVFVYDEEPGMDKLAFPEGVVHRWNKGKGFSPRLAWEIAQFCRREGIDLIHAHDQGPLIYGLAAKLLSGGRIAVVFTSHSFVHLKKSAKYSFYEWIFPRWTDQVCVVAPNMRDQYEKFGLRPDRVEVVENGVEFVTPPQGEEMIIAERRLLRPEAGDEELRRHWILYLGRLHPGKGQDRLLGAWSRLPPSLRRRYTIYFVGGETSAGYRDALQALAGPEAVFVGASSEPGRWIRAADVLISASEQEGLPLGPLEAMGGGLPVLLSDIPGHRAVGGEPAWMKGQNLEGLEEFLHSFRPVFPRLPDERIRARYSTANMADQYIGLYLRSLDAATPEAR